MRNYCSNCANWDWFRDSIPKNPENGCKVVVGIDKDHPVKPQTTFLNYAEANKNGDCEHYKDKLEGLGLAKEVHKAKYPWGDDRIEFAEDDDEVGKS